MEPPEGYEGREVQLQSKTVCRDCEYLSAPPAVECEHTRAVIARMGDGSRFLVIDCPKVEEI